MAIMLENVRTRSFYLMIAQSLAIGGNAGAHFILAALLEPALYGSLFFFITALNFILMGAMMGFQHVIMHQAPRMAARKDDESLTRLVYDSWSVCAVLGLAIAALFAFWHFAIRPVPMPGAGGAVLCLLWAAPLWALIRIILPFLLSRGATFAGVLPDQGFQALGLLVMIPLASIGLGSLESVSFLLAGQIVAGIAGVLISIHYVRKYYPALGPFSFRLWEPIRQWRALNFPFFAFSVLQQSVQRLDLLLLGVLAGPKELAVYALSLKIAQLLNFPAMASKAALAPRFSVLFQKKEGREMRKLLLSGTLSLSLIGFLIGAGLYGFSPWIFSLIGALYEERGGQVLLILLIAEILVCVFTPLKINALMGESQKFLSAVFGAGLAVSLLANIYLIPLYGALGAAWIRLGVMLGIHSIMALGLVRVLKV